MSITIYVASHKPYPMPQDSMYIPIQVGAIGKVPIWQTTDATNDHISQKNPTFCELTGLYWIWKNSTADYIGLVHYRRHFIAQGTKGNKWKKIITRAELERHLAQTQVILPKQRHYVIETNWSQYAHAHHEMDLSKTRECIADLCSDYLDAFDIVMKRSYGHRFNMMVMQRDVLAQYCQWLFSILFELEIRLDLSDYSAYDARVFGFIGERLLDVWVEKNQISFGVLSCINMENEYWLKKIYAFFLRKIDRKEKADAILNRVTMETQNVPTKGNARD